MGYRSDICIAVGVPTADAKKVMALYMLDPRVQQHGTYKEWERRDRTMHSSDEDIEVTFFVYKDDCVKWYSNYDDVQAVTYLLSMLEKLGHEAQVNGEAPIPYAHITVEIGEEYDDTRVETEYLSDCETSECIYEHLTDTIYPVRSIEDIL